MIFYTKQHKYYCGIDLHARTMYVCIIDQNGKTLVHRNLRACVDELLKVIEPFREDICIGVECTFTWYWIADLCDREGIPFVLDHALYLKAIHGGKSKNDKVDSQKIAVILRGGMFPTAYVYPGDMRATRDLLRRRMYLMHKRAELLAHIENTNSQYNLPPFGKKLAYKSNRSGVADRFPDPAVKESVAVDLHLLDFYDKLLNGLELFILKNARVHDPQSLYLLQTTHGIAKILSLVMLYEIHDINRFPTVADFISYCRLVKPERESAGKKSGSRNAKIGNVHLKWAFSEAAVLFLKGNEPAQKIHERRVSRYGKSKALAILAQKLARAVYFMLKRKEPFDMQLFLNRI
ncbi:MAG: IS110 family transposase [Chloroflexi bacterium CG07_land_8_20_14_0_80_51_10]|nr:MAG: IS110 family transposase [Chloroflexi bacterium CG07_land_8_20_14_0_80_51_10]